MTRFDEGGFEWSERCDCLASMSAIFLLFFSLSLLFSKAGNHLKWKWKRKWFFVVLALIFGQLEMLFSLTKFEVTTKHLIFWKIISEISFKSKQTEPKKSFNIIPSCYSNVLQVRIVVVLHKFLQLQVRVKHVFCTLMLKFSIFLHIQGLVLML